ncbi:enhancer of yellow 2 transcription factor [Onthophagus taurus]|uniref:enhancer of yellow 2 transcription factor n=1 Tax=Onthophagus taurus TaxID=166361 RepID=UPI000C20DDD6|nr:enhancer of yellow 2 transcription factor [Onthophagus taurus]
MAYTPNEEKVYMYLENRDILSQVAELVEARLVDCGWRDQVRMACRKNLCEGTTPQTMDKLSSEITPVARGMVPDAVKKELLQELEQAILTEANKNSTSKNQQ